MKKRMLAMLICIAMILGIFPTVAMATETGTINETAQTDSDIFRYTVLILDTSGSMSGTPASVQKDAAIKFCESVTNAAGTNYVAIVRLNTTSSVGCGFTTSIETLKSYINSIGASGGTNINQALSASGDLLNAIPDETDGGIETIKNVVLCSDGLPQSGTTSTDGPYTSSDYSMYMYANAAYNTASVIKEKNINIYTLGFFHSLSGSTLEFGRKFMTDLASEATGYYEVINVDDLEFEFGDIAEDITKGKDSDGDGLPDSWEINGVDTDRDGSIDVRLDLMGADPNIPDIFVEVDWMVQPSQKFLWVTTQEEVSLAPSEEAMRIVYESFKEQGINLHIDAGPDSIDFVIGNTWGELSGGNEIPYEANFNLGSNYEHWKDVAAEHFSESRTTIFRYCLFINQYNGGTSSGIANNIPGQYFIVANQEWVRDTGATGVAGTFMHELGHTLGLSHGGFDHAGVNNHTHYKPNYLSIMNYLFQTSGLVGTNEVNYSCYTLPDLNEDVLSERDGIDPDNTTAGSGLGTKLKSASSKIISPIAGMSVDFNDQLGIEDSFVSVDLNNDGEKQILTGTSDWEHIIYDGGDIGYTGNVMYIKGLEAPNPETEEALSELTYEEALDSGVLANKGTGAIEALGPYTLSTGMVKQATYIRIKNLSPEESTFSLHIDDSELCKAFTKNITLDGSIGDLSYIDVPIFIKGIESEGVYYINATLIYEDAVSASTTIPVELRTLTQEDVDALEQLINSTDVVPDIVKQEYVELHRQLVEDKQSTGSGQNNSSAITNAVAIEPVTNGKVTVDRSRATTGTTVNITVQPDEGYELDNLTVTDKYGNIVKLTQKSATQYTFTMPASKVDVKATFAKIVQPVVNPFTDVREGDYFYDAVLWAVDQDITTGTSNTTFSPGASCTRAQMVTFLWRAAGSPAADGENPFTDVNSGDYYYHAVLWAVEKGITKGTSDTAFSPNATVTRGQTVTFLYRYEGSPAVTGNNAFVDVAADAYYAPAVQWAVNEGITKGTSDTSFSPLSDCTRGQIVTFLYRTAE